MISALMDIYPNIGLDEKRFTNVASKSQRGRRREGGVRGRQREREMVFLNIHFYHKESTRAFGSHGKERSSLTWWRRRGPSIRWSRITGTRCQNLLYYMKEYTPINYLFILSFYYFILFHRIVSHRIASHRIVSYHILVYPSCCITNYYKGSTSSSSPLPALVPSCIA